jgi:DNA processing protein
MNTGPSAEFRQLTGQELPAHLTGLPDAPQALYVKGALPDEPGVAIVGTRRATAYGRSIATALGRAVAAAGWPVISGLARGIDACAHRGTVEMGGRGVAVLGSGIDVWYPKENRELGEDLLDGGGAVCSEYEPGTTPEPWRFPARNRIISGLAAAVVVVEAARTGGALITARLALEQGREVLAVPGDVDRETSAGCNLLIRDGAHPVLGADDLVEALTLFMGEPPAAAANVKRSDSKLLDLVPAGGILLEDLVAVTGRETKSVLAEVAMLETEGLVESLGGLVARR